MLRIIQLSRSALLFFALTISLTFNNIAKSSEVQAWSLSGFNFKLLQRSALSSKNCYLSESRFLGCLRALNFLAAQFHKLPQVTVDETPHSKDSDSQEDEPEAAFEFVSANMLRADQKVLSTFGPLAFVKNPDNQQSFKSLYLHDSISAFKSARDEMLLNVKILFHQAQEERIFFEEITEMLRMFAFSSTKDASNEAALSAAAYNVYLNYSEDPHTYIALKQSFEDLNESSGQDVSAGIGFTMGFDKRGFYVAELEENAPAQVSGLRVNDVIEEIDGVKVRNISNPTYEKIYSFICSKGAGSVMRVSVKRKLDYLTIPVLCAPIKREIVVTKVFGFENRHYGYIRIRHFMSDQICTKLKQFIYKNEDRKDFGGWILDLRGNGGGRDEYARCVAGVFLHDGSELYSTEYFKVSPGTYIPQKSVGFARTRHPLVVLIDSESASASELVAGALRGNRRAFIVGEASLGKGTMQFGEELSNQLPGLEALTESEIEPLKNHVVALVTKTLFYQPGAIQKKLSSHQGLGIKPDIEAALVPGPVSQGVTSAHEADLFYNYIKASGVEYKDSKDRASQVEKINKCVQAERRVTELRFELLLERKQHADFAFLSAVDALACMGKIDTGEYFRLKQWDNPPLDDGTGPRQRQ